MSGGDDGNPPNNNLNLEKDHYIQYQPALQFLFYYLKFYFKSCGLSNEKAERVTKQIIEDYLKNFSKTQTFDYVPSNFSTLLKFPTHHKFKKPDSFFSLTIGQFH